METELWFSYEKLSKYLTEHFKNEYGTDIKIAALIGSDFLTKIKGKINFKEKTMSFDYGLPC